MENQFSPMTKEDYFSYSGAERFSNGARPVIMEIGGEEATAISMKLTNTEDQIGDITIVAGGTAADLIWFKNGEVQTLTWGTEDSSRCLVELLVDFTPEQLVLWVSSCISLKESV